MTRKDAFVAVRRCRGIRATDKMVDVFLFVIESEYPVTSEDVDRYLEKKYAHRDNPNFQKSEFCLRRLLESGLIQEVSPPKLARYAAAK